MSEPRKFSSLLSPPGQAQSGPAGRPRHCSRCLALAAEYERHDPSWTPPEASSYVKDGVVYWLGCESCSQLQFDAQLLRRLGAVGNPNENGITDREREKRQAETAKLHRERELYAAGRKAREQRYAKMSGRKITSGTSPLAHSDSSGPVPGEAALTSSTHGAEKATDPRDTPAPRGEHRGHVPSVPSGPPDYAMLRAEPGEGFADWWEEKQ